MELNNIKALGTSIYARSLIKDYRLGITIPYASLMNHLSITLTWN